MDLITETFPCNLSLLTPHETTVAQKHTLKIFELVLEKAEEPDIKLLTSTGSPKKQESSRKTSISAIDYAKAFDCGILCGSQ